MNSFDIEELLSLMFGVSDAQREDGFDFDDLLYDNFAIGFDEFSAVVAALLPLTPVVASALTGKKYHAFIKDGLALVKMEAKDAESD